MEMEWMGDWRVEDEDTEDKETREERSVGNH